MESMHSASKTLQSRVRRHTSKINVSRSGTHHERLPPKNKRDKKVVLRHTTSSPYYSPYICYVCISRLHYTHTSVFYYSVPTQAYYLSTSLVPVSIVLILMVTTYSRAGIPISIWYMNILLLVLSTASTVNQCDCDLLDLWSVINASIPIITRLG